LNSAFAETNQAGRESNRLPILSSIRSLNGKAVAPAKPINPKPKNPEKSPDFCYSWLNLLQICETTKPPQTITKAALNFSKWLFNIQQNNPSYKQRIQDIKLN
jgi:hypothetical protein